MACSIMRWRAIAKSSSSTGIGSSATAGCCRPGPLREPRARLTAADAVVVNGGRALLDGALSMRLEAKNALSLIGGTVKPLR